MVNNHNYINSTRTKQQRKVRYCFLRQSGFNRNLTRSIVGRRDTKIILSIQCIGEFKK